MSTEENEIPQIPGIVRAYGTLIQFLQYVHVIALAYLVAIKIIEFWKAAGNEPEAANALSMWGYSFVIALAYGGIGLAVSIVLHRVGGGLKRGMRGAVWGLCVWCGIGLILVIISGIYIPSIYTYIGFGYLMIFYYPPVVAAYIRWEYFH